MKADMIYGYISSWLERYPENTDYKIILETKELMEACRKEMMDDEARRGGVKAIQAAAKRIIKNAKTRPLETLWGMFTNKLSDGSEVYCVCDGFHAVRFKDRLPLEEIEEKYRASEMDMNDIIKPGDWYTEIELPNIVDVKIASKVRARPDDKKDKSIKPLRINKGINLWVNPAYLLDMMECLPGCKAYAGNNKQIIYFKAENGDGCLCPVFRSPEDDEKDKLKDLEESEEV